MFLFRMFDDFSTIIDNFDGVLLKIFNKRWGNNKNAYGLVVFFLIPNISFDVCVQVRDKTYNTTFKTI